MFKALTFLLVLAMQPLFAGEGPNPQMCHCKGYLIRPGVPAQEVKNFGNMIKAHCDNKRDQDDDSIEKMRKTYCSHHNTGHKEDELYVIWDDSLGHRLKIGGHVLCKDLHK
jgi:hypothetical protein